MCVCVGGQGVQHTGGGGVSAATMWCACIKFWLCLWCALELLPVQSKPGTHARHAVPPLPVCAQHAGCCRDGHTGFNTAERRLWHDELFGEQVLGYVKTHKHLTHLVVRNAGHMVRWCSTHV